MKIKYRETNDKRVVDFNDFIKHKYPQFFKETKPDLILVAGGDGAMLHAIQELIDLQVPFFGKAQGSFNFLMNIFDVDTQVIEGLLNNLYDLYIVETGAIDVNLDGKHVGEAVNEVLIGNSINGYHDFTITTEDLSFNEFKLKGCGICVSTPLGSTGYNFNNRGPILPIGRKLWAISSIVCNQHVNDLLNIQSLHITVNKGYLFLDGIKKADINSQSKLVLSPGKIARLAFLDKQQFLHHRVGLSHRLRK